MRIGQTSFVLFTSKVLSSAAGFVATIFFARLLGAEVLGSYYLFLSIVAWLSLAGSIGIGSAITKRVSEGSDRGEYKLAGGAIICSMGIAIIGGLLVFDDIVAAKFGIERIDLIVFLLAVGLLGSYVDAMLRGEHLVHVEAVLKVSRRVARTALQIGGVLVGFKLAALVGGYALGGLVLVVIGFYVVGGPYRLPDRHHFERLYEYARYAWIGQIEGKTFQQADIVILGLFTSSSLVGVYGITWNVANFLIIFSSSISGTLFPEFSKLSEKNRQEQVATLVEDSLTYAGLVTIPGLVGGLLLSDWILQMYGEEFVQGTKVLGLLILSVLFYGYQTQFANALGGIDLPKEAFKINAILIGTNLFLNVVLVYLYGIIGAAVASATSTLLGTIGGYFVTRRHISVSIPTEQIGRQILSALGMGVIVLLGEFLIGRYGTALPLELSVVLLIGLGAISYVLLLGLISPVFRSLVSDNVPMLVSNW